MGARQAGALTLRRCDVCSSTGSGVAVEGAELLLDACTIHDCARHGVAAFGSLEGTELPPGRG